MKKINLAEFQTSKLTLNERLNTKGGSGSTTSRRTHTSCSGSDSDSRRTDSD
jgi:hypothetical protein